MAPTSIQQKVVFAHDLGQSENQKLLDYYPVRRIWLLTFDGVRIMLAPYPGLRVDDGITSRRAKWPGSSRAPQG
jgi:hypothetical protein